MPWFALPGLPPGLLLGLFKLALVALRSNAGQHIREQGGDQKWRSQVQVHGEQVGLQQNKAVKGAEVTRTDHKLEAGSGKLLWILHIKLGRGSTQIFPVLLFTGMTFTCASCKLSLE